VRPIGRTRLTPSRPAAWEGECAGFMFNREPSGRQELLVPVAKRKTGGSHLTRGFSDDVLSRVQQATDLADVVGETVSLRRRGKKLWGLCPFHGEKTPSFSVDPDRQLFYCFGCRVGGNVFTYLMRRDGLTFPEAVRRLGERAGIPVDPDRDSPRESRRAALLAALAAAQAHFRRNLADIRIGRAAREFLEIRGVTETAQDTFGLGWAPDSWQDLTDHLMRAGYQASVLVEAGLSVSGERGPYDRMRGRITFPIWDADGRIVGFGGRVMGAGEPKYLNSPETLVYHKGRVLYGAHLARGRWRTHPPVLVEGYFDVIACHQAGVTEAVATLGTGLTADHAKYLGRQHNRVILAYDRDAAGRQAAERAFQVLAEQGISVYHIDFESGKDLDELLGAEGPEAVREAVAAAEPYLAWRIRQDAASVRAHPDAKGAAWRRLRPLLQAVADPVERQEYAQLLERQWSIDPRILAQAWRDSQGAERHNSGKSRHNMVRHQAKIGLRDEEADLLGVLLQFPEQLEGVLATFPELCMDTRWAPIVEAWPLVTQEPLATWIRRLPPDLQDWVVGAAAEEAPADPRAAVKVAERLKLKRDVERLRALQQRAAEGPVDPVLAGEIRDVWNRIREHKQGLRREGS
jgi:DNA primase